MNVIITVSTMHTQTRELHIKVRKQWLMHLTLSTNHLFYNKIPHNTNNTILPKTAVTKGREVKLRLLSAQVAKHKNSIVTRRNCIESIIPVTALQKGIVFGRPFVKRFALCYRSVVCPVCLSCLSSYLSCLWRSCTVAKRLDGSRWNSACR